jgi:hypothetical protein
MRKHSSNGCAVPLSLAFSPGWREDWDVQFRERLASVKFSQLTVPSPVPRETAGDRVLFWFFRISLETIAVTAVPSPSL